MRCINRTQPGVRLRKSVCTLALRLASIFPSWEVMGDVSPLIAGSLHRQRVLLRDVREDQKCHPPPQREAFYLGGLFRGFPSPCPASFMKYLPKAPASRALSLSLSLSLSKTNPVYSTRSRSRTPSPSISWSCRRSRGQQRALRDLDLDPSQNPDPKNPPP